jgi:hypothetical protein
MCERSEIREDFALMLRARRRTSTMVSVVVACATVMAGAIAVATPAATAAPPPADAPPVSLIGDSTMAAMGWYSSSANDIVGIVGSSYRTTFDAESCRRIVVSSCRGRFGSVPRSVVPLMRTTLQGMLGEALVVMAGYDDPSLTDAIDQVMAEARAQGVVRVMWLDYRTGTSYILPGGYAASALYTSHNAELAAAAARYPDLQVLGWNTYTATRPSWFASDGIHLTVEGAVGLATYIRDALDAQPAIGRCRVARALTGTPDPGTGTATVPTTRAGFVPRTPVRVLDTRESTLGGAQGKVGAGRTVAIDLDGVVPDGAIAAALSVTAVDSCVDGFLTVFGCGTRPPTSNLNVEFGRVTAGLAITPLDAQRRVCVFSSGATDLVVDVTGSFTPGGARFHPLEPIRWVDTRGGAGQLEQLTGRRDAPAQTQIDIRGQGGVPAGATAVWLNLTVADPVSPTVLTAYPGPCGTAPLASNVNARPLRSTASAVLVGLGSDGSVCVATHTGSSDVVIDVAGWFGPGSGGLSYRATPPSRLLDTRDVGPPTDADQAVAVDGVAVLNIVSVDSTGLGWVTARPCGSSNLTSLINSTTGEDTANLTALAGGTGGSVCARSNIAAHLVIDQVARFAP